MTQGYDYNFTDHMAAGKRAADARRARGLATGKAAKGWRVKRRAPERDDPLGCMCRDLKARFRCEAGEIREGFRFDLFGKQWEGL